ncbi:MAG TPA: hypothetical protein VK395_16255 [Gemmataceae bacterium]|nr:hypothetical protein [Gemmataceae bacterium]
MSRVTRLLCVGVAIIVGAPAFAAERGLEGTFELSYFDGPIEVHLALIHFETKDGKLVGNLVGHNTRMGDLKLTSAAQAGKTLRIKVQGPRGEQVFEGKLGSDKTLGSYAGENSIYPAKLAKSDLTEIVGAKGFSSLNVAPLTKVRQLSTKPLLLRNQARREQDEVKKAELVKQAKEAAKVAEEEVPGLYREVLEKHADSPAVFQAGFNLLRDTKYKPASDDIRKWAGIIAHAAKAYGRRYEADANTQLAEVLGIRDDLQDVALEYAKKAEKSFTHDTPAEFQVRVLKALATVLRKSNQASELKVVDSRIAKLDAVLDREYFAKMPPFKPAGFPGRKAKSDRVVVMELFTGAQCPPCVAADAAFDGLEKVFKPMDVVLLQYHLHIPGPDPLTNADTIARAKYYKVSSTPSTLFNGKSKAGGGGGLNNAENKFKQYREIIDPLLEDPASVHLTATAHRQGEQINIKADVAGLPEPGDNKRLRFVLVEEAIRYVGSNRMRFHHQVVRAFPGGVEGIPLKQKDSHHATTVDVNALRKDLVKYLDESAKVRPYPYADRPLDLKNLKVVVLVQDDDSKEILQAAEVDLGGGPSHQITSR